MVNNLSGICSVQNRKVSWNREACLHAIHHQKTANPKSAQKLINRLCIYCIRRYIRAIVGGQYCIVGYAIERSSGILDRGGDMGIFR